MAYAKLDDQATFEWMPLLPFYGLRLYMQIYITQTKRWWNKWIDSDATSIEVPPTQGARPLADLEVIWNYGQDCAFFFTSQSSI